jgi:hypothetical protein
MSSHISYTSLTDIEKYPQHTILRRVVETLLLALLILVSAYCILCLTVSSSQAQTAVNLAWDANTDSVVNGYKVYTGTASRVYGTPVDVGKVLTYKVANLTCGSKYYFSVTAYGGSNPVQESGYSNEVSISLLCPPTNFKIVSTSVAAVSKKSAILSAATSSSATSSITYTSAKGTITKIVDTTPQLNHATQLNGLKPHTSYTYTWNAKAIINGISVSDSASGTFSTN